MSKLNGHLMLCSCFKCSVIGHNDILIPTRVDKGVTDFTPYFLAGAKMDFVPWWKQLHENVILLPRYMLLGIMYATRYNTFSHLRGINQTLGMSSRSPSATRSPLRVWKRVLLPRCILYHYYCIIINNNTYYLHHILWFRIFH